MEHADNFSGAVGAYDGDVKVVIIEVEGKKTYLLYPDGQGVLTIENEIISAVFTDGCPP